MSLPSALSVAAVAVVLWLHAPIAQAGTIRLADEATIAADAPVSLTLFRYAANPAVLVLDFPSFAGQGNMLNRLAALTEKRGVDHDHLLDDAALATAIRISGETPATWYYGHDYRATDLFRFFRLADAERIPLNNDEQHLRLLVGKAQSEGGGFGALISLPAIDPAYRLDASGRATILHHELSHGDYFTEAAYADYVDHVWQTVLTSRERRSIRAYLAGEGYDPTLEDLMINEMQAYLIFTPDPRYFAADRVGIAPSRLADIRRQFAQGLLAAAPDAQPRGLRSDIARIAAAPPPGTPPP